MGWYTYALKRNGKIPRIWLAVSYIGGVILLACNAIPLNESALFFATPILWASVLLTLALIIPAAFMHLKRWRSALLSAVSCMFVFMTFAFTGILPQSAEYISGKAIAEEYISLNHSGPVYIEKFLCPALAFYGNTTGISWESQNAPDFATLCRETPDIYVIMQQSTYNKLLRTHTDLSDYNIIATTPGQVILAGRR